MLIMLKVTALFKLQAIYTHEKINFSVLSAKNVWLGLGLYNMKDEEIN